MLEAFKTLKVLASDRKGVTAVEYAVIAGVICLSLAAAFTALTVKLNGFFNGLAL